MLYGKKGGGPNLKKRNSDGGQSTAKKRKGKTKMSRV